MSLTSSSSNPLAHEEQSQDPIESSEAHVSAHQNTHITEGKEEVPKKEGTSSREMASTSFDQRAKEVTGETRTEGSPKKAARQAALSKSNCEQCDKRHAAPSKAAEMAKPGAPSDANAVTNEIFLSELQPLPSCGGATCTTPREPGAHAIHGRAAFARNEQFGPMPQCSSCRSLMDPDVVHEAVVCEDTDTEEMIPDASATYNDVECGLMKTEEVVDGKILQEGDNDQKRKNSLLGWLALLLLLLVGLAVLLPLLLSLNGSDNPDIGPEEAMYTSSRPLYPPFQEDLPAVMISFIEDPEHPHSFANTWIWQDPHRQSYSRERQLQRFHLASFYYSTHGDDWDRNDDWLSYDVNECEWFSQHYNDTIPHYEDYPICDEDNNYLVLNLASNNLQGHFPLVRNFIKTLRTYDISNNHLSGSLPSASQPALEVFIVSNNKFEGLIVGDGSFDSWGLRVIKMDGNDLYGVHEPLFLLLKSLEVLDISGNNFGGNIPKTAALCKNLTHFAIADNEFEGTIPPELSALENLQEIDFSGNKDIVGSIPSELGLMPRLVRFDISGTAVSGEVPATLCSPVEAGALDLVADCGTSLTCCKND